MADKERRIQIKVGPDRWLIQDDETAGWIDIWVIEAIAAVIHQVEDFKERCTVELIRKESDENKPTGFIRRILK